ncbi:hypothetical protein [Paraliomyxa miuraensis]|uniref:hypothetical protein n=1 Tax=Paraliomyxa miuraensis TaxID=376150 RepID=UPI00225B015C|nr:hypothetical protein [Paraliomyxa miuraensis]MCX4239187.1 hypothetical protein [Paraliomyxa miuraensis]
MNTSLIGPCLAAGALAASFGIATIAHGSQEGDREIPTQIVNVPEVDDANGACSKCRVDSVKAALDVTQDSATLELYYDDERGDLLGTIELTILLSNGQYRLETIEGVDLQRGSSSIFDLKPGDGWSWALDVEHVWVEVVPFGG